MGRMKIHFASELVIVGALVVLVLAPACRKERPPLDRNRAPETFITSAPTETTAADYRVHMYWHGTDPDGVVVKYIYYITDTLITLNPERNPDAEALDWNPSQRIADYLKGRFTTKTDTVIIFKGFNEKKGAMVNRQAFHIVAIDDEGKLDPTPARLQFNARVKGVPTVQFWTDVGNGFKAYRPDSLDTISMLIPFSIKFLGSTVNNIITGYRWSYGDKVYPSYDGWRVPANQLEAVIDTLPHEILPRPAPPNPRQYEVIPSGVFNFKALARDEAGALSRTDLVTGEGVCRVVVNHDPDTKIVEGLCHFLPQSAGNTEAWQDTIVNFSDGIPDTLPYRSLLKVIYLGWDDPKDLATLAQKNPPLPIRFQFMFKRWTYDEYGSTVAGKNSPWYPLEKPEDTNPKADRDDLTRNQDSTTMRVGTFNYTFFVRSFDEQNRPDGTPAAVGFIGNFPPKLDSVQVGFYDPKTLVFNDATNDTIRVGWLCGTKSSCGGKLSPYLVSSNLAIKIVTKYYKFVIRAGGHDDRRDPPGSGIKGWKYHVTDPEEDLSYYKEGEWMFDEPLNEFEQECAFSITVAYKNNIDSIMAQADSIVAQPPAFLGVQTVEVTGSDIAESETFPEEIRGITPQFDENGRVIPGNYMIRNDYSLANYARRTTGRVAVVLQLVK